MSEKQQTATAPAKVGAQGKHSLTDLVKQMCDQHKLSKCVTLGQKEYAAVRSLVKADESKIKTLFGKKLTVSPRETVMLFHG